MSPARESDIARWMGTVDARLSRLLDDMKEERVGSAEYRKEMRERMEGQDHSLADLEHDVREVKEAQAAMEPVVSALNTAAWKQRGAILVLSAVGSFGGAVALAGVIKFLGLI